MSIRLPSFSVPECIPELGRANEKGMLSGSPKVDSHSAVFWGPGMKDTKGYSTAKFKRPLNICKRQDLIEKPPCLPAHVPCTWTAELG